MKKNFKTIKLNEVADLKRGPFGGALKKNIFVPDGYKVYEQKNAIYNDFSLGSYYINSEKYQEMKAFEIIPDDIIMSCSGTIGKLSIAPQDAKSGIINQALLRIRPSKEVYSEYLKLYLESEYVQKRYLLQTSGTAMQNLKPMKVIKEIPINLPDLETQSEILSKIKECFILLDKSEQKLKQAEEKLSLVINSSNKLFKTKTSNITYKLSEVFKLRNGKFNPSSNLKNNFDTEFKFKVYGGNGVTGYFNKALVQGQTIIIGRVGAKCGSIHKSKEPVWVTDNALYIETFLKEVDLEFLYWKLISLNLNGLSDGTGQPKIDQSKIYNLTIDIPNTIEEQKRIARQFEITNERVNNSLAQIQSNKSAIQNIRQSILKKAFEGTLI